jgi:hypothetical protein
MLILKQKTRHIHDLEGLILTRVQPSGVRYFSTKRSEIFDLSGNPFFHDQVEILNLVKIVKKKIKYPPFTVKKRLSSGGLEIYARSLLPEFLVWI